MPDIASLANPLAVLLTLLIAAGIFVVAVRGGERMQAAQTARLAAATPAEATITAYEDSGLGGRDRQGHYTNVRFTLEVRRPGQTPYQTHVTWQVYPMGAPNVQPGKVVPVKVDAENAQIVYPDLASVAYNWSSEIKSG